MTAQASITILNVDDGQDRSAVTEVLRTAGFEVTEAASAADALRLAAEKPHLVIVHGGLADAGCEEVCRKIKANPATASIPLLQLGGVEQRDSTEGGSPAEANGYLAQPVEPSELLAMVKSLLRMHEAQEKAQGLVQQWQAMFDAVSDGICLLDAGGRILRCNRAMAELVGKPEQELAGQAYLQLVQRVLDTGMKLPFRPDQESTQREVFELASAGRWFRVTVDPIRDAQGRVTSTFHVWSEITTHKEAEERLRHSEHYYRVLFETNPQPMWVYDIETLAFLAVNDAALHHYGFSREEFLRMSIKDIRPPEDIPLLLKTLAPPRRTLGQGVRWRHRMKNGAVIDVEVSGHPLTFAGRPAELVLVHDLTEHREAQEERTQLFRERAKLADHLGLLLESTGEGIAGEDMEGRCTFINRAAAKMLGYSPAELLGKKMHPIIHHKYADGTPYPEENCPIYYAIQKGQGCHIDNEVFWRRDGSSFPIEYSSHPIVEEGAIRGAVITFIDISERKHLEEQFRQAQKMEAVGRLAGGVAHDFNNLLTIISGYSELILANLKAGDPLQQHMKEIKAAASRAAALTSQLLAFSRKQIIAPKVLDLNAVVADMNKMLYRVLGEDVELAVEAEPELGHVKADPGQLHQVILNLAVNARDAMPQGGKMTLRTANVDLDELYARAHLGVKPGPYVLLEMSDTGCGMTEDVRSHIFEPFFTTKEAGKGTGLGLSTVYGIVQQSGGHITVASEVGKGTTFAIYLPRVDQPAPDQEAAQPVAKAARGTETVLVVEDEDMVRNLIRMILRWNGYTVLEARRGKEALRILDKHKQTIHLLVTDVIMPEMNGVELARRVVELRPDIKVLYMSGYTGGALNQAGISAGETAFIQKPFTPEALSHAVRNTLDK